MKPIKFKEHNIVFAENQPEYTPLPAFKSNTREGEVVACYKLSFIERLRLLFIGKLWICLLTFNQPLTPIFLTTQKEEVLTKHYKKWYCKLMSAVDFRLWFCECHYHAPYGRVTMMGCKKHD